VNWYAHEKIREFEAEDLKYRIYADAPRSGRRPVLGSVAGILGRALLRAGESLEAWSRPAEPEPPSRRLVRRTAR
jgi:hypothetical protein